MSVTVLLDQKREGGLDHYLNLQFRRGGGSRGERGMINASGYPKSISLRRASCSLFDEHFPRIFKKAVVGKSRAGKCSLAQRKGRGEKCSTSGGERFHDKRNRGSSPDFESRGSSGCAVGDAEENLKGALQVKIIEGSADPE